MSDGGTPITHPTLPPLGRRVVTTLFARRHESDFMREIARAAIRDARLWKRLMSE